jgi:RES domain-containing protein
VSGAPPPPEGPEPPRRPARVGGVGRGGIVAVLVAAALVAVGVVVAGLSAAGGLPSSGPDEVTARQVGPRASSDGYAVWERNDDGTPVRWDPCSPIELVVSAEGLPTGGLDDLSEALDRLVEVTGLDLRVTGTTDERPRAERPPYQPNRYGHRWAPVLIAWASPHEGGIRLRSTDRGVAVPIAVGAPGDRTYVTGQVALNAERTDLDAGFDDRSRSWGSTVLHELVHVLGLDHVDDPTQLMYVHPGEGPVEFGDGDLVGLAAVGAEHGCRRVPAPQHVDVADPPR